LGLFGWRLSGLLSRLSFAWLFGKRPIYCKIDVQILIGLLRLAWSFVGRLAVLLGPVKTGAAFVRNLPLETNLY
jgi:hypothetical protein